MQQQQQQQQQRRRRRRRRRPRRTACRRGRGWGSSIKSTIRGSDAINLLADSTRFFVPREVTATTSARQASPPAPLPPPPAFLPSSERASEREGVRGEEEQSGTAFKTSLSACRRRRRRDPSKLSRVDPSERAGAGGGGTGMENERRTLSRDNLPISELGGD
jgi:hypothetical protein